ncbi:MAG: carboxypeptidase-like regulatory domain-containing protein, partial [Mangrovibacterium sp.]
MIANLKLSKGFFLAFLLSLLIPLAGFSQEATVKGKVVDKRGASIPGVSIVVVGTTNGTLTNIDGEYQIKAPTNSVLRFTFVGYKPVEITATESKTANVTLHEDSENLDEVVVVGYGQMKRSDLTGSVVSVASDAIEKSVPTSVDQVLQGRAAGVQVQQNSGAPGASSSIRIRGINSLNASNEPIFVIDGVVIDGSSGSETSNPLSTINPSDIVSMDVLKDASATAIYGSRAG